MSRAYRAYHITKNSARVIEATELLAGGLADLAELADLAAELSEAAVAGLHGCGVR